MKKYKLTDKWPEPLRGKEINSDTNSFDYIAKHGSLGIVATFDYDFVGSFPELFEPIKEITIRAKPKKWLLADWQKQEYGLEDYEDCSAFNLEIGGKKVTTREIEEALKQYFNKPEQS